MGLSRVSGVAQYTISKFLTGRIKSLTPDVQKFMQYAFNGINASGTQMIGDARIVRALFNAWDGTEAGIAVLASTIHALGPVIRHLQVKTPVPAGDDEVERRDEGS